MGLFFLLSNLCLAEFASLGEDGISPSSQLTGQTFLGWMSFYFP